MAGQQKADGLGGLNDVEEFKEILKQGFQKTPARYAINRNVEYMDEAEEREINRAINETLGEHPEGLARVVVAAVGKNLPEALTNVVEHSKHPFYPDGIVVFKNDGTVEHENDPVAEDEGNIPAGEGGHEDEAPAWPKPQGRKALRKIAIEGKPKGYHRISVWYGGEVHGIKGDVVSFKVCKAHPFGEFMSMYATEIGLPLEALEFYHGPNEVKGHDTLDDLGKDKLIYLQDDKFFVQAVDYEADEVAEDAGTSDSNSQPPTILQPPNVSCRRHSSPYTG